MNLTANWDGTVDSFIWSKDGKTIYTAIDGKQNNYLKLTLWFNKIAIHVQQVTNW
jgi:hypothetical protein